MQKWLRFVSASERWQLAQSDQHGVPTQLTGVVGRDHAARLAKFVAGNANVK